MDQLLRIGFHHVGYWMLDSKRTGRIQCSLRTAAPYEKTLYAFIVNGDVKYVGKTTRTLAMRMKDYEAGLREREKASRNDIPSPRAPSTNARVGRALFTALSGGDMVEIYVLPDVDLHHYGDFHLNLAAGLEDSIIEVMAPAWNGGKKVLSDGTEEDIKQSNAPLPPTDLSYRDWPIATVFVKMGKTYWDQGFFNVSAEISEAFGADGENIEIFCGDQAEPLLGTINRRANSNQTPRIFGGKRLREWIQPNLARDATMRVDVLTPTAIRLSATSGQQDGNENPDCDTRSA
jgi:hypothetical protein